MPMPCTPAFAADARDIDHLLIGQPICCAPLVDAAYDAADAYADYAAP